MIKEPHVSLFDLVVCLSDAVDLVSPALVNHHKQVAYLASSIGREMGYNEDVQKDLVLAGALHDIGALSLSERIETVTFETSSKEKHQRMGALLVGMFQPLAHCAPMIRYHHQEWNAVETVEERDQTRIPLESHILHLADRIAVLVDTNEEILGQVEFIRSDIKTHTGTVFHPEVVDAFLRISYREHVWFDLVSPAIYRMLRHFARIKSIVLDLRQLSDLALVFSKIIDFRSSFTATHSYGVAVCAEILARQCGLSQRETEMMRIAGHLHDLGKLAVSRDILEKKHRLTDVEYNIIRSHTYHTFRILDTIENFDTINSWASFHHERLNGLGYPFRHDRQDLSLGSRIMGVADVFAALAEERPYRPGLPDTDIRSLLNDMVRGESLDGEIVSVLLKNYDTIDCRRAMAQNESFKQYRELFEMSGETIRE